MTLELQHLKNSLRQFKEKLREEFDYKTNITTIIRKLVAFIDELVISLFTKNQLDHEVFAFSPWAVMGVESCISILILIYYCCTLIKSRNHNYSAHKTLSRIAGMLGWISAIKSLAFPRVRISHLKMLL